MVDRTVSVHGRGPVTTPSIPPVGFTTGRPGEQLLAFVGSDGPSGSGSQTTTVSGAGLTWTLVKRANTQAGTAEVWTAFAPAILNNVVFTATRSGTGYDMSLYVIAVQGTKGIGASVSSNGRSGAPSVVLTTTGPGSLIYATGNDYDRSVTRIVGPNQMLDDQWLDTQTGDTYWTQNQTGPPQILQGTPVRLNDSSPINDRWNFVAVEILAEID